MPDADHRSSPEDAPRDAFIHLRIAAQDKQIIQEAARRAGKSITTFIVEAALRAARQPAASAGITAHSGGLPTYLLDACLAARRGGAMGYDYVAYQITRNLVAERPAGMTRRLWKQHLRDLLDLLNIADERGVWEWFRSHLPDHMRHIPRRRWRRFVHGVHMFDVPINEI